MHTFFEKRQELSFEDGNVVEELDRRAEKASSRYSELAARGKSRHCFYERTREILCLVAVYNQANRTAGRPVRCVPVRPCKRTGSTIVLVVTQTSEIQESEVGDEEVE